MAWVVILLMISFVGGIGFQQLLSRIGSEGERKVVGRYDGGKVRNMDLLVAQKELELLKSLMSEQLLYGGPDWNSHLLGLHLFPDNQAATSVRNQFAQAAMQGQIQTGQEAIDRYFTDLAPQPELMWMLLKAEARKAGCVVSTENALTMLQQFIPAVTQGMYGQRMDAAQFLYGVSRQTGRTEQEIANVFAELLGILKYGDYIMRNHQVTYNEMQQQVQHSTEKVSGQYYVLKAEELADQQPQPSEEEMLAHLAEYKDQFAGSYSDENPFGFGYKVPRRAAFEYLYLNLNDVKTKIDPIGPEDLEQYYSRNLSRYQEEVDVDAQNPDAGKTTKQLPFAQVAGRVRQDLERERIESLAGRILNEARQITEAGFNKLDLNQDTPLEQLQQAAGEYPAAAAAMQEKYGIAVHVGKTSALRPQDYSADMVLRGMGQMGPDNKYIQLREIAWQIPVDGSPVRRPGLPSVRQWESISPLMGGYYEASQEEFVRLMAMVRITEVKDALAPQTLDVEFPIQAIRLTEGTGDVYSLRADVAEDLKLKKAMNDTMQRANALVSAAEQKGWDEAVKEYRQQYTVQADPNEPAVTNGPMPRMQNLRSEMVPSRVSLALMQRQMEDPRMAEMLRYRFMNGLRSRTLYNLLGPDQETTGQIARPVAFAPAGEIMIARELTREPATVKDFSEAKDRVALETAYMAGFDLGLIHYNTDNIIERMDYVRSEPEKKAPAEEKKQS